MAFQRVAHYPFKWRDLRAAELEVLSYGTRPFYQCGCEATVALREFVGDDGKEWQVWDTRPAASSPNAIMPAPYLVGEITRISKKRERGWLTFTADADRRRLSPIPKDWETADEASLRTMLAAADPVANPT
jgi:hypothetical protein